MRSGKAVALVLALTCPAGPALAQDAPQRLSVHGYLTQAYGKSSDHQILGISDEGTFDYRTGALQVRYDMDATNVFVLQLSHERVGDSPLAELDKDLELDWLFYQHRFSDSTTVRVGRVPIPVGIYNQIRDVGTLLPFYRPPDDVYRETSFASETLDGIVVSRRFGQGDWGLEVLPYLGQWEFLADAATVNQARKAVGVQLWLETPVDQLRVGAGARRHDQVVQGIEVDVMSQWSVALDGRIGRFTLQGEYISHDWQDPPRAAQIVSNVAPTDAKTYYGLVGFRPVEKVGIFAQASFAKVGLFSPLARGRVSIDDFNEDWALVLNLALRPDLVLKLEGHRNEGRTAEDDPLVLFAAEPLVTRYGIVSLSVSF